MTTTGTTATTTDQIRWQDITPEEEAGDLVSGRPGIDLSVRLDITAPLNEIGEGDMTERPEGLDDLLNYVAERMDVVVVARKWITALDDNTMPDTVMSLRALLKGLVERVERYEKNKPSWRDGTPEDYDAWLRDLTPDDRRLAFYQWIGKQAVAELVEEARQPQAGFDGEMAQVSGASREYADGWNDGIASLPLDDGPYPSKLPVGKPFCDDPSHAHAHGGTRLPGCRLGWPEE
jgi:hypothetical protein